MESREVFETGQCGCLHLVVGDHASALFSSREGQRSNSLDDELDMSDLRRGYVFGYDVVRCGRSALV